MDVGGRRYVAGMGYTGAFVALLADEPLAVLAESVAINEDDSHVWSPGSGWHVAQLHGYELHDRLDEHWMAGLAARTGAPVLVYTVAMSDYGEIRGFSTSGWWHGWIDPRSAEDALVSERETVYHDTQNDGGDYDEDYPMDHRREWCEEAFQEYQRRAPKPRRRGRAVGRRHQPDRAGRASPGADDSLGRRVRRVAVLRAAHPAAPRPAGTVANRDAEVLGETAETTALAGAVARRELHQPGLAGASAQDDPLRSATRAFDSLMVRSDVGHMTSSARSKSLGLRPPTKPLNQNGGLSVVRR